LELKEKYLIKKINIILEVPETRETN